jgi:Tn3 transposase DDE domain
MLAEWRLVEDHRGTWLLQSWARRSKRSFFVGTYTPKRCGAKSRKASANSFILYGKGGEIATNDLENQELTMLALHLLQIRLVYINTLMIQRVLTEPDWTQRMLPEDLRALTPLIYSHVTPYGTFRLDMNQRLAIEQDAVAA